MSELLNILISDPAAKEYFRLRKVTVTEMVSALPTLYEIRNT